MDNLEAWEKWKTEVQVEEEITPLDRVRNLAGEIKETIEQVKKQQETEEPDILSREEIEEKFLDFKERIERAVEHIKDYLELCQPEKNPEEIQTMSEAIKTGAAVHIQSGLECYLQAYFLLAQGFQEGTTELCDEAVSWAEQGEDSLNYSKTIIKAATEAFPAEV